MGEKTKTLTVTNIDPQEHLYFSIACKREGVTASEVIRLFIRNYGESERRREEWISDEKTTAI